MKYKHYESSLFDVPNFVFWKQKLKSGTPEHHKDRAYFKVTCVDVEIEMEKILNFVAISPAELGAHPVVRLLDEGDIYLIPKKVFLLGKRVRFAAKQAGLTACNPTALELLSIKNMNSDGFRIVIDMEHMSAGPWFDQGKIMEGGNPPIRSGEECCFADELLLFRKE